MKGIKGTTLISVCSHKLR